METQKCNKCSIVKPLAEYRMRYDKGYHHKICKKCNAEQSKDWLSRNREDKNKKQSERYKSNKEYCQAKALKHYYDNKDQHKKSHDEWKKKNPDYYKKYMHDYTRKNREAINNRARPYNREHYRENDNYRLRMLIGGRIRRVFNQNGVYKNNTTLELLGCSFEYAKEHIVNQFTDGMTWEKFRNGEIHIDHIRPCSSFDLTSLEQQKICFHHTNLQPLWARDNLVKGDRYCPNSL